jgi:hypothetical protein
MQIEIKTTAYAQNKNFNTIYDAVTAAGYSAQVQSGGKQTVDGAVTITTDAPEAILDGISYTKSAVTVLSADTATFSDTVEAEEFIETAASRETSTCVMQAITFFARDINEAEDFWNGDFEDVEIDELDIWERATGNGVKSVDLSWGDAGERWATDFTVEGA